MKISGHGNPTRPAKPGGILSAARFALLEEGPRFFRGLLARLPLVSCGFGGVLSIRRSVFLNLSLEPLSCQLFLLVRSFRRFQV